MKTIKIDINEECVLINALNAYWHDANDNLMRSDLGHIEREQYIIQRDKSKSLITKIHETTHENN